MRACHIPSQKGYEIKDDTYTSMVSLLFTDLKT